MQRRPRLLLILAIMMVIPLTAVPAGADDVVTTVLENDAEDRPGPIVVLGDDGNPILHVRKGGQGRLISCDDPFCAGGDEPAAEVSQILHTARRTPDGGLVLAGDTQYYAEVGRLGVTRCADVTCSAPSTREVTTPENDVELLDMQVTGAGHPVMLYSFSTPTNTDPDDPESPTVFLGNLKLARCLDPVCADVSLHTIDQLREQHTTADGALVLTGDDRPIIVVGGGTPEVFACVDATCSSVTGPHELAATPGPGEDEGVSFGTSIVLGGDGFPTVAWQDRVAGRARIVHCDDVACADEDGSVALPSERSGVGQTQLALADDGNPTLAFRGDGRLRVAHCNDPACTGDVVIGDAGPPLRDISMAIDAQGYPVIGLSERDEDLLLVRCDDRACTDATQEPPPEPPGPDDPDVAEAQTAAIDAAVSVSQDRFFAPQYAQLGEPARFVVLATVESFADALSGTVLTAHAPLLLTHGDALNPSVATEIDRVLGGSGIVYLLGGTAALGEAIEQAVATAGYTPVRLAGASRFETSRAIADVALDVVGDSDQAALARGDAPPDNPTAAWADAITGGAWSAEAGVPVVLTPAASLHPAAEAYLAANQPGVVHLLGGTAALDASYDALAGARRTAGQTRFDTARQIALQLWEVPEEGERTYMVLDASDPYGWAFGLPAAGRAADIDAPMLAVGATAPPPPEALAAVAGCDSQVLLQPVGPLDVDVLLDLDAQDEEAC